MQPIAEFFWNLGAWNWFFLGVVLFVLETILPGVYLLWFGMAAGIVGVIALTITLSWQLQVIAFGLIAMATVVAVRRFARPDMVASDEPSLNERGQQYVGRIVTIEDAIANGRGRVRVGDTVWSAEGPDLPKGARATVKAVRGTVLLVEPVAN